MKQQSLIKFWIGPVQSFVAAARTSRDLWTGSYLLSWLVAKAAEPALTHGGGFVVPSPDVLKGNLSMKTPTLPNHFTVRVEAAHADVLEGEIREAVCSAWKEVCDAVLGALKTQVDKLQHVQQWDRLWTHQVEKFFDVRVVAMPCGDDNDCTRFSEIGRLLAADKMIRHFPPDTPLDKPTPGKCSLLGSLEQMGPAGMQESREFWEDFARKVKVQGTRVKAGERLCAVSLVKRFAWPAYLAKEAGEPVDSIRIDDTPRIAAKLWLKDRPDLEAEVEKRSSAPWLYWQKPDQEKDEGEGNVDPAIWQSLLHARRVEKPPTYYAVLTLDGDNMGKRLQAAKSINEIQTISAQTGTFARDHVQKIVAKHSGDSNGFARGLVYGGGDDVLALLPAKTAVACEAELSKAFGECLTPMNGFGCGTVSAGIAVVHHKEDLRFALEQSREAEQLAKHAGRDRLCLRICRRSGEHTTAIIPWQCCHLLEEIIDRFVGGVSDRWTHRLRTEADMLLPHAFEPSGERTSVGPSGFSKRAMFSETERLLDRMERPDRQFVSEVMLLMEAICGTRLDDPDDASEIDAKALRNFITLCQSASFMARGRDE